MILNYSWAVWLAWGLGAFFVVKGVLNMAGLTPMRVARLKWGHPSWFPIAGGALDLLAGLMTAWYPTRPFGLAFGLLVCLAEGATLIRHRDWRHLPPSLVLFALTVLTGWGLRLI